jgi:uncharacterized protein with NRDE domain
LIIASNRDEFLARKTARAAFHSSNKILSGIDLERNDGLAGTWIGMNRDGKVSFLTNYREHPSCISKEARSRGLLTSEYLDSKNEAKAYCEKVEQDSRLYNGYNLVVGNVNDSSFFYVGNRPDCVKELESGKVYGISNGSMLESEPEWPKVVRGKQLFKGIVEVCVHLNISDGRQDYEGVG